MSLSDFRRAPFLPGIARGQSTAECGKVPVQVWQCGRHIHIRIIDENEKLGIALEKTITFGTNYKKMTEAQQFELGSYVNLMSASTQLLVNPILGLKPDYSDADFESFISDLDEDKMFLYKDYAKAILAITKAAAITFLNRNVL